MYPSNVALPGCPTTIRSLISTVGVEATPSRVPARVSAASLALVLLSFRQLVNASRSGILAYEAKLSSDFFPITCCCANSA